MSDPAWFEPVMWGLAACGVLIAIGIAVVAALGGGFGCPCPRAAPPPDIP